MKKIIPLFYALPAIIMGVLYALGTIVVISLGNYIAIINMFIYYLPVLLGTVLLIKGKWYGSLILILRESIVLLGELGVSDQKFDIKSIAVVLIIYYIICGIVCYKSNNKKEN